MIVLGSLSSLRNTLGMEDHASNESLNGAVMSFEKKRFINTILCFACYISNLQCSVRDFNL